MKARIIKSLFASVFFSIATSISHASFTYRNTTDHNVTIHVIIETYEWSENGILSGSWEAYDSGDSFVDGGDLFEGFSYGPIYSVSYGTSVIPPETLDIVDDEDDTEFIQDGFDAREDYSGGGYKLSWGERYYDKRTVTIYNFWYEE